MSRINVLTLWNAFTETNWATSLIVLTAVGMVAGPVRADLVRLERVVGGLSSPVYVTHAPGDEDRLFVVEKGGTIRTLDLNDPTPTPQPFLTVSGTDPAGEGGLLGLAFHPNYATNGKYYVYVTVDNGGVDIDGEDSPFSCAFREYTDPAIATAPVREIISWVQPRDNHNGGWIGFSPIDDPAEASLYISSGDGGKQEDPDNNAQTLLENNPGQAFPWEPLGKILRIDVNGDEFSSTSRNYAIPEDNPFADDPNASAEIWAYGLRNPWRASFDRRTGDFWIGDVGQGNREEIDFQPAASNGGEDYGWKRREGTANFAGGPMPPEEVFPVYDYGHGSGTFEGNSIVGGYIYRGPDPEVQGTYIFGNSFDARLWSFDPNNPSGTRSNLGTLPVVGGTVSAPVAFGEDAVGNLYVVDYDGEIFRFVTDAVVPGDFNVDGDIDDEDLVVWETGYGMNSGADALDGDADGDGDVDGRDFLTWQRNYGKNSMTYVPLQAAGEPVPEPTSLCLGMLSLTACGFAVRRGRGRLGSRRN